MFDDTVPLAIAALGIGVIFGSFLNALLFRFNTGKSMGGRSRCMRCNHTLSSLDLVPVFSYVYLRGKCRYCHTHISIQYPLIECVAGFLSLGLFYAYYPNGLHYVLALLTWLTILFIVVYDWRHMIIPYSSSIILFILSMLNVFLTPFSWWQILAGPLLALPFFAISFVSRGRWMGWGDSGFQLSLGILLGLQSGLSALLLGVWSGAIIGLILMAIPHLTQKIIQLRAFEKWVPRLTIKSEIPFAPFLALGALLAFFFHVNFFSTFSLF